MEDHSTQADTGMDSDKFTKEAWDSNDQHDK